MLWAWFFQSLVPTFRTLFFKIPFSLSIIYMYAKAEAGGKLASYDFFFNIKTYFYYGVFPKDPLYIYIHTYNPIFIHIYKSNIYI
jgi:hypothetical protein